MVCWSKPPPEPQVDVEAKLKELEDRLNAKIMELSGSVINDFTLELTQLKERMDEVQEKRTHSEKVFSDTVERHAQQIHDLRKEITVRVDQHGNDIQELRESGVVETLRQELLEQMSVHREELVKKVEEKHLTHSEQLMQLQKVTETTSQHFVEELKSCHNVIETHRTEIHQEIQVAKESTSGPLNTQCDQLQGGLEDVSSKLVQSKADLERSVQTVEEHIQVVRTGFENSIADCLERLVKEEQATHERVQELREAIHENLQRIEINTSLAENVYCRSVQWNCRGSSIVWRRFCSRSVRRRWTTPAFDLLSSPCVPCPPCSWSSVSQLGAWPRRKRPRRPYRCQAAVRCAFGFSRGSR